LELRDQLQSTLGDAYRIERELAAGGMARVFVAQETTLGRRVVVKTLSPELAGAVSTERFRREIRLAASLQQANIVPVHSAGEMDGVPYYTMPYVEGESLRSHLTACGALPVREAVGILRDVARALAFAHERGVVHRDIKPENVLLSGSTAVVTDFGIAKALEVSATHPQGATLTQLGTALGTPAYMSPEQATGDPNVDHRADIYALGVLAYELLAGAPPFTGRSLQALVAAHVVERPPDLTSRSPSVPRELAALVMRCLEKDPARRPQSAREVLDTLEGPMTNSASAQPSRELAAGIAVLPFANLSPEAADEYFADGLTDEIITDLAAIRALRVIARGAMMRFKATTKEPVAIARELGVRYVLDGSVRRGGSSLRMTARLIDAADGSTLWTDKLGGAVEDVFAMQEKVSHTIVEALQLKLSPREEQQIRARPMSDLRAYECFLQARQALWTFTPASLHRAERLLEEAQSLIGNEPRLLAGLAGVHLNYADTGQGDTVQHTEAAARYVSELVKASPTSFERYLLEGWLQFRRGEIREAIASLTLARELEPNNPDLLTVLCYTFILAGRDEDALQVANMAICIDPLTPLLRCMPGFCAAVAGRPDEAVAPYREFADLDPSNPAAHFFVVWSLLETGQREECGRVADRLFREFPSTPFGKLGGAVARGLRGDTQAGLALLTPDVRSLSRHSEMFARALAAILTMLGDHEGAIDALTDDVRLGFSHYPFLAHRPTALAPLRSHPRFRALLEVVRQRWERGGASAEDYAREDAGADR